MNRSSFLELMKEPSRLSPETEPALRELLVEFPYFAAGHQLLTRNYQLTGNYRFDKQLHLTAVQVPSRNVLYDLLNTPERPSSAVGEQRLANATVEEQVIEQPAAPEEVAQPELVAELPAFETEQPLPEPSVLGEHSSPETTVEEGSEATAPEPESIEEVMVRLENAWPGESGQDVESRPESPEMPETDVLEMPSTEEQSGEIPKTEPEPETEEEGEEEEEESHNIPRPEQEPSRNELAEAISGTEPHSFMEWLQWSAAHKVNEKVPTREEIQQPEETETISQPVVEKPKKDQEVIIEKFLTELPRISRPATARFFKAEVAARESIMEDENLVSETLARLHVRQGNIQKAIRIYEKLCLKYPDKKLTFASQIDELRQELNR